MSQDKLKYVTSKDQEERIREVEETLGERVV
jgi:hypothetical protein